MIDHIDNRFSAKEMTYGLKICFYATAICETAPFGYLLVAL